MVRWNSYLILSYFVVGVFLIKFLDLLGGIMNVNDAYE